MSKKLAIIVGHNSQKQGAVRADNGQSEFEFNTGLAKCIHAYADASVESQIFFRKPGVGYPQEVIDVYKEVDQWGADAAIELHFNAAGKTATGTEVLSSGTPGSMALAGYVQDKMVDALGLPDRGVKVRADGGRGSRSLMAGKAPTILIEPFFGSNPKNCAKVDEPQEVEDLAYAIVQGALQYFEIQPRRNLSESRTIKAVKKQKATSWVGSTVGVVSGIGATAKPFLEGAQEIAADPNAVTEIAKTAWGWSQYIEVGIGVLLFGAAVLFILQRVQANKVERARKEDHEKGQA
jgi:N-acetylmuramoyl-L-alanine amidase